VKILQLLTHHDLMPGGAVQAWWLAIEMARRGHEVALAYSPKRSRKRTPESRFEALQRAGVAVTEIDLHTFYSVLKLRRFIHRHRFDVVHAHRRRAISRLLAATWGKRRPLLIANRGNTYHPTRGEINDLNHPRYRKIIVVAHAVKRILIHDGIYPDKICVIYGGVDTDEFSPQVDGAAVRRELFPDAPGAPIVGMLANIDRKKSHDVFIRMAARIIEKRPDVRFAAVGRGESSGFQPLLRKLNIHENTVFTGYRSDAAATLAAFDISVITASEGEGLTGAIRESLSMAKPVVTTDVGGNREIVHNEKTGLLVPPGDPDALAAGVLRLLENPLMAAEMGREGRRLVMGRFSLTARGDAMEALYTEALHQETGRQAKA
jgi:glycosyltransferase involved in cell wall biosynthesis